MGGYYSIRKRDIWVEDRASWTSREGTTPLLLLHGGLDHSASLLTAFDQTLRKTYRLIAFDRSGHGRSPVVAGCFTYEDMAEQTLAFIADYVREPVNILGASDGAAAALLVARSAPNAVKAMILGGGNFHHEGLLTHALPSRTELADNFSRSSVGQLSPEGESQAAMNAMATWDMWHTGPTLTTNDLKSINTPTLVLIGDDEPIDLKHSVALYESLPHAQFAVIPGASHAALQEKPKIYAHLVAEFLSNPSNPITQEPIRRRHI